MNIINRVFTEDATSTLVFIFTGIVVLVFVSVSWILNHHWENYGVTREQTSRLRRIYFSVSVFLLLAMTGSLLIFFT